MNLTNDAGVTQLLHRHKYNLALALSSLSLHLLPLHHIPQNFKAEYDAYIPIPSSIFGSNLRLFCHSTTQQFFPLRQRRQLFFRITDSLWLYLHHLISFSSSSRRHTLAPWRRPTTRSNDVISLV